MSDQISATGERTEDTPFSARICSPIPFYEDELITLYNADCLELLPKLAGANYSGIITSPPYWAKRDYRHDDQIGLEDHPDCLAWATQSPCAFGENKCFICKMSDVFGMAWETISDSAICWIIIDDTYANLNRTTQVIPKPGHKRFRAESNPYGKLATQRKNIRKNTVGLKEKDLCGIPSRLALALQSDGWYWRSNSVWHKPNCLPDNCRDRPHVSHETILMMTKAEQYAWSMGFQRTVFTANTNAAANHSAAAPLSLCQKLVQSVPVGETILDPFCGTGTTLLAAKELGRRAVGIEINQEFCETTALRLAQGVLGLGND